MRGVVKMSLDSLNDYSSDKRKKAIKMIIVHIKKKISTEFIGSENIKQWVVQMDELLTKKDFNITEYVIMRKKLNDIIDSILDEDIRYKLRDSWYSFGKALDKKIVSK
jgi:hypothetical protein